MPTLKRLQTSLCEDLRSSQGKQAALTAHWGFPPDLSDSGKFSFILRKPLLLGILASLLGVYPLSDKVD